jgi:hypothetical protein
MHFGFAPGVTYLHAGFLMYDRDEKCRDYFRQSALSISETTQRTSIKFSTVNTYSTNSYCGCCSPTTLYGITISTTQYL